jgi:uncharacterized membrane protein YgcG
MATPRRWVLNLLVGLLLAGGGGFAVEELTAFACCRQCECVQLCCDAESGCGGDGICSTFSSGGGCGGELGGGGCSFACPDGGGEVYCCAHYGCEVEGL